MKIERDLEHTNRGASYVKQAPVHEQRIDFPHKIIHRSQKTTKQEDLNKSSAPIALHALAYSPDYSLSPQPQQKLCRNKHQPQPTTTTGKRMAPQGKCPPLATQVFLFSRLNRRTKLDSIKK